MDDRAMPDGSRTEAALRARHGVNAHGTWSAPGRANLIGEHTDYNEGFALPFALDRRLVVAAGARTDHVVSVSSDDRPDLVAVDLDDVVADDPASLRSTGWAAYPLGVARMVLAAAGVAAGRGSEVPGIALHVCSAVPPGAGLSSSAALECATALAFDALWELGLERPAMAAAGQWAEALVVGAPTGAMDQIASLHGRPDTVLFLDCRALIHRPVPFDLDGADLAALVVDTGEHHDLADGAYAERVRACEEAAARLGVRALRDLGPDDLDGLGRRLGATTLRRVRHVVTENVRVGQAVAALERLDPAAVGPLLDASHASLRDDFEVSTPALDLVASTACRAGALGARLTGAGFGGSVLCLVPRGAVPTVVAAVEAAGAAGGLADLRTFVVRPGTGAGAGPGGDGPSG